MEGPFSTRPGASTVPEFLRANGIGRTKFYSEIAAGRLRAVRCGSRTLVLDEDAAAWRRALPELRPLNAKTPAAMG